MKLRRTWYGYVCASDTRLQFHDVRSGWEVRRNGRRGGHHFATLREAKEWAGQFWRPWFVPPAWLEAGDRLLHEALRGDRVALLAYLDQLEENGRLREGQRSMFLKDARRYGLAGGLKVRQTNVQEAS